MKVVAVIPSRYSSSRFPGKPLVDIFGHPMLWWVYQRVLKVKNIDEIVVATDDDRIVEVCKKYGMLRAYKFSYAFVGPGEGPVMPAP